MGAKNDKESHDKSTLTKQNSITSPSKVNTTPTKTTSPGTVTKTVTKKDPSPRTHSKTPSQKLTTQTTVDEGPSITLGLHGVISIEGDKPPVFQSVSQSSTVNVSSDGSEISYKGYGYYGSWGTARANVKLYKGRWCYEITIKSKGSVRLGWCTEKYTADNQYSSVGSDEHSWAYDPSQQKKFYKNSSGDYYGEASNIGDVIGAAIDFDQKRIWFYKNGVNLGTAFNNVRSDSGISPAISISGDAAVNVNFGPKLQKDYGLFGVNPTITQTQKSNLESIFSKYSEQNDDDEPSIKGSGTLDLVNDLGSTGPTDPLIMLLAWKMRSSKQWDFNKSEWMLLWTLQRATSESEMKKAAKKWREEIKDQQHFKSFYIFIFDYLKATGATVLETGDALMAWKTCGLAEKWGLFGRWEEFWSKTSVKGVSRDTWNMLITFIENLGDNLNDYNENDCWPVAIDDFVTELKKEKEENL